MVRGLLGEVDTFFTANDYVRDLLSPLYRVLHTVRLVPPDRRVPVTGTLVREAMARGDDWRLLVPPEVAAYLDERGLADRFRREFGAATLDPTTTDHGKETAHVLLGR
jgi:nicotinamide-nucleotide adenylyltransferase